MKDAADVRLEFKGAVSEITAGKVLFPKDDLDRTWNGACDRAIRIVNLYIRNEGLFQIDTESGKPVSGEGR